MSDRSTINVHNTLPPSPQSNGLGVAGFVISLVGILFCMGLLCPLGLILSAVGLRKEPRGLAIAGLILGLIGSVVPVVLVLVFGITVFGAIATTCMSCLGLGAAVGAAGKIVATQQAMERAQNDIEQYRSDHGGVLPADLDGNAAIFSESDAWSHHLRYSLTSPTRYELRSAGPDGTFDNADDISRFVSTETAATTPSTSTRP